MTEDNEIKYIFNSKSWTKVIYGLIFALSLILSCFLMLISYYERIFPICCEILICLCNYLFLKKFFYPNNKKICFVISVLVLLLLSILLYAVIELGAFLFLD